MVERKKILKSNLVVFDETVVGDPTKLNNVVEFRDKGAARVCRVRDKQLCVQIPVSSNDGRILFIADILKGKTGSGARKVCMVVRLLENHCKRNQPQ